ncbi:hypothetical protein BSLG_010784 [Batrachochytrium salamandrivorans]|nr:hypothetical protein BSLG_010784 [Batrachochytrium salamandrivorans]
MRKYPYTTDLDVNPLKYQDAVGEKERHNLGEIWTTMLLEVYWNLVEEYGFSANLHDATQKKGNIIFLQLFRGLGIGADSSLTDDYSIPQECQGDRYIRPAADSCIKPIEPLRIQKFVIDI